MSWPGEAGEPWLPTYAKIVHDYPDYGFPGLEILSGRYPLIDARRTELKIRFYERYASRMINKETKEQWQLRLQNRFDEVAPMFERAYRLYAKYKENVDNDVLEGYKHETKTKSENGGSDETTTDSTGKEIDTPDSYLNDDDRYADRLTKDHTRNTTEYGASNESSGEITHTVTGAVIIENLNLSITSYRDIDTEFVAAFENNFLNIFWS